MEREKFLGTWKLLIALIGVILILHVIGYADHGLPTGDLLRLDIALVSLLILLQYLSDKATYLEIQDETYLINSGYRTFGKDRVKINDIKYICRTPTFIWHSWGSTMILYLRDDAGSLTYTALREVNFSDDTLKKFLRRILQIKSSIELDQEYKAFMAGKFNETGGLKGNESRNTPASIENYLKSKGETWAPSGPVSHFFEMFR